MPVEVKYTRRSNDKGWLGVKVESYTELHYLCENTKVAIYERKGGKTYFTIEDGNGEDVGKRAYLSTSNEVYLINKAPNQSLVTIRVKYIGVPQYVDSPFKGRLLQQWADITMDNGITARVTLNSVWPTYTPIPIGTHMIMAPDRSHANIATTGYARASGSICTDVWFPIKLSGHTTASSRYIHIGHLSEGCVTVYELSKWNDIYNYLIDHRMPGNGGKFIGQIIVSN